MAVGAYTEDSDATGVNGNPDSNAAVNSGAVYVFTFNGELWSQQAYIKASNTDAYDSFSHAVAISGDTLVVGAPDGDSGATWINGNQANNAADPGLADVFFGDSEGSGAAANCANAGGQRNGNLFCSPTGGFEIESW